MEPELKFKTDSEEFWKTSITQKNVLEMMGKAVDLIESHNLLYGKWGGNTFNPFKVLMHSVNNGKLIPGLTKRMTARTIINTGTFWIDEPKDGGEIDRWLKCAIEYDCLEIFLSFGTLQWLDKYVKYGIEYGPGKRWLHYFFNCKSFTSVFVKFVETNPALTMTLIDMWKMVLIPDILKSVDDHRTTAYHEMLKNPVYHQYMIKNFPLYSSKPKKEIMIDIMGEFDEDFMEETILQKDEKDDSIQKCQDRIDF